jgi:pimeloyl-ACP methyl ester carboxylesterase
MHMQEAISKQDEVEIYYRTGGEGEALLLLHGFFGSGAIWEPYLARLGEKYRLVVPDLRGHGRSTNPGQAFTHRQSALDMAALLDELGIDTYDAIGFSSGGMTLLHMATQQPGRVRGLALLSATSYFPESCRAIQRQVKEDPVRMEQLRRVHQQGDDQVRALIRNFQEMANSYDDMNFTPPLLGTITARTIVIHGDRDEFFPVSIPVELYHAIPKSALWILPNTNHDIFKGLGTTLGTSQDFIDRIFDFWDQT